MLITSHFAYIYQSTRNQTHSLSAHSSCYKYKSKMKGLFVFCAVLGLSMCAPVTKNLQDDLDDFKNLIPIEKLLAITCEYKDDPEVVTVVEYLRGEEWAQLVAEVAAKQAWQDFKIYLSDAGVDIESVIALIHGLITNGVCDSRSSPREFQDLVHELEDAIPIDDIKALFYEKLQNSADFQELYAKVSSDDARQLFEEVRALDEVQHIAAKLEEYGLDLQKVVDLIYGLLGWN